MSQHLWRGKEARVNKLFIKEQLVNAFGFVGHMVSEAIIQHYSYNIKLALENTQTDELSCVPLKFHSGH